MISEAALNPFSSMTAMDTPDDFQMWWALHLNKGSVVSLIMLSDHPHILTSSIPKTLLDSKHPFVCIT